MLTVINFWSDTYIEAHSCAFAAIFVATSLKYKSDNIAVFQILSCDITSLSMTSNQLVQYVVVRGDLLRLLSWPTGAVIAQACHASTAALWSHRNDPNTIAYTNELDDMHKVVLEVRFHRFNYFSLYLFSFSFYSANRSALQIAPVNIDLIYIFNLKFLGFMTCIRSKYFIWTFVRG